MGGVGWDRGVSRPLGCSMYNEMYDYVRLNYLVELKVYMLIV